MEPEDAEKMSEMSVYWSKVKIYENFFPNDFGLAVPRKVATGRLHWEYRIVQKEANINILPISCEEEGRLLALLRNDQDWSNVDLRCECILHNFDLRRKKRWGSILMDSMLNALQRLPERTKWYWSRLVYDWIFRNADLHREKQSRSNLLDLMLEVSSHVAVNHVPQDSTRTPMMFAAKIGDTRSMLRLIWRGARVTKRDGEGWTALHFAAYHGNEECCKILRDCGADIRAKTNGKCGRTPLEYATSKNVAKLQKLLK